MALWLAFACTAYGAEPKVVYLGGTAQGASWQQADTACRFYGLHLESFVLASGSRNTSIQKAIRGPEIVAVIIGADVLGNISMHELASALKRGSSTLPVLIADITQDTNPALLKQWSEGVVTAGRGPIAMTWGDSYSIGSLSAITRQLSGQSLVEAGEAIHVLAMKSTGAGNVIMTAVTREGRFPLFVNVQGQTGQVFLAGGMVSGEVQAPSDFYGEPETFSTLAPTMMFLRYATGDRAWHTPGDYANLTIDDAWLHEPLGPINYGRLLQEMDRHNFHTTIAFIPWNFDRSQSAAVSLFRKNPDRFSVCVHGDNHDHKEFGDLAEKPLSEQSADIRQAIARMDKFSSLTQIPSDRVMVFPHSIGTVEIFRELRRYNFLATFNAHNVPMGAVAPADPLYRLRPMTLAFADFASVSRYSAEIPPRKFQLVIDAFLGNPMLFYVHPPYFAKGIDRFDSVADEVNRLRPDTEWRSLGYISRHLYLERRRSDGNYDVEALTNEFQLENHGSDEVTYFVHKKDDFAFPFTITVDSQPEPYRQAADHLEFQVTVPAHGSRLVWVRYHNDFESGRVDIAKSSLRIRLLRYLSDFRDMELSRVSWGRNLTVWYTGIEGRGMVHILWLILVTPLGIVLGSYCFWRRKRAGHRSAEGASCANANRQDDLP
jgi:hypothetical protein